MSSLTSNLKKWGAQGSSYPDGYKYLAGEQPVDEWDNYLTYHTVQEIHRLQNLANSRLESGAASSHPSSPEVGHLSHRTDTSNLPTSDEALFFRDASNSTWHRLLTADGDKMTGPLDMGQNNITGVGDITAATDTFELKTSGSSTGRFRVVDSNAGTPLIDAPEGGQVSLNQATLATDWLSKQEGGAIAAGAFVPLATFGLDDGETLHVTQATLTEDGFTTPADSGVQLRIVPDSASAGSTTGTTAVLAGDGSTLYDDETSGWSYQNTSGDHQTVAVGIDNGRYGGGTGVKTEAFGGFIARVV